MRKNVNKIIRIPEIQGPKETIHSVPGRKVQVCRLRGRYLKEKPKAKF